MVRTANFSLRQCRSKPERAMFGQHHVHEIPFWLWTRTPEGQKSLRPASHGRQCGGVGAGWFGLDYYAYMPRQNPGGPASGRYKGVRSGSWKSKIIMLRTATQRLPPDQRSATLSVFAAHNLLPTPIPPMATIPLTLPASEI